MNDDPVNMDFPTVSGGIILSGASGMLGNALTQALNAGKPQFFN